MAEVDTLMLTIRALRKSVGAPAARRLLFDALELDVAAAQMVAVMGESGSGKSTLLNLVAGLDTPDAGSIEVAGVHPARLDDGQRSQFRRRHLGFVFQAFHLLPHLSVADNVALPLVITGHPAAERRRRTVDALGEIGLADRAGSLPRELSGGEMQRVAIARALVHEPSLILADEPTGNLDADNAALVLALLRRRVEQTQAACLLVTHSATAAKTAHGVYVLSAGKLDRHHPPS